MHIAYSVKLDSFSALVQHVRNTNNNLFIQAFEHASIGVPMQNRERQYRRMCESAALCFLANSGTFRHIVFGGITNAEVQDIQSNPEFIHNHHLTRHIWKNQIAL